LYAAVEVVGVKETFWSDGGKMVFSVQFGMTETCAFAGMPVRLSGPRSTVSVFALFVMIG
jgi:hypothetical protein